MNPKVGFARGLLVKILDELLLLAEEEKKLAETISAEVAANQAEYDARTAESHPQQPEYGRIRIGIDAKTETKTGQQLETLQMRAEIKRRNMWRVVNLLRGTKGLEWETSFRGLVDCLFGSKLVASFMPDWLAPAYFKQQGSATVTWRKWCGNVLGYMTGMLSDITSHQEMLKMEAARKAAAEAEKLGGMSELQRRREQLAKDKKVLAHKLESLGIKCATHPNLHHASLKR